MKILAIRGQNLASLKGAFEIDLEAPPLSGTGLFAIAGPVGAGKSTLLDTLCLALFGRTPRLSGRGGAPLSDERDAVRSNDPRSLVRKGAALAFAEVDFRGADGGTWRARWQVRRARGQCFGRLLDSEHSLVGVPDGERHGSTNSESLLAIEQRLGLSFEELSRSVLLSQGGFSAFLQARPDERAALLEKITGTAIYSELSMRAFARARDEQVQVQILRDAHARCTPLPPLEREALAAQLASFGQQRTQLDDDVLALSLHTARAEERARQHAERRRALARAASAAEWRARAEDALAGAERTHAAVLPEVARARTLDAALTGLGLSDLERTCAALDAERASVALALAGARATHEALAREREAVDAELARAAGVRALLPVIDGVREDLSRLAACNTDLEGARAMDAALARNIAELEHAHAALMMRVDGSSSRLVSLRARLPDGVRALPLPEARGMLALVRARLDAVVVERLGIELAVEERALARIGLAASRAQLVDGEPCPLCGAAEHPWAHRTEDVTVLEQRRAVERLRATVAARREARAAALARAQELGVAPDALVPPALAAAVSDSDEAISSTALDALDATLVAVRAGEDEQALLERERAGLARDLEDAQHQHALARRSVEGRVQERAGLERTLTRALAPVGLDVKGDLRALARTLKARVEAVRAVEARSQALDEALAAAAPPLRDAQRGMDSVSAQLESATHRAHIARARALAIAAERSTVLDGADADGVATAAANTLADARAAVAEARAASASANAVCASLTPAAEADDEQPVDADALHGRLLTARTALARVVDEEARVRARLHDDDALRKRHDEVSARLAQREDAARVWTELAELIGSHDGARFRAFAQGLTLDTLVHHANEHLALLAPRYRLERIPAARAPRMELSLCVVDRDAGDERRGVQSLSGGETFLVSLALALGLSSLSSSRVRVESLFIDEGFSSLDPDTLEVALAAFDALRSTGRQVGVISHVPALAERIGSQVRVLPLGDGRSRVEVRAS